MSVAPPEAIRLGTLNRLLGAVWQFNPFYARKWREAGARPRPLSSVAELTAYPLTTREELLADQAATPPLGANLTGPPDSLKRFYRSSGTTRAPLLWADSDESWEWVTQCSRRLWQLAGMEPSDRALFLMPFGASSGPWIIYEGACQLGAACFPLGQAEPAEQLQWLARFKPTVVAGKPPVLESLALAAKTSGTPPRNFTVRKLILCGAHDLSLRTSLNQLWGAQSFNRYGLTEAGSVAAECTVQAGKLHLLDDEFIAESIDPNGIHPVPDGDPGELVLTTLGRITRPIIRYRTGDLVRLVRNRQCSCGRRGAMLFGGITRLGPRAAQGKA